jgi:hypothetical protein
MCDPRYEFATRHNVTDRSTVLSVSGVDSRLHPISPVNTEREEDCRRGDVSEAVMDAATYRRARDMCTGRRYKHA